MQFKIQIPAGDKPFTVDEFKSSIGQQTHGRRIGGAGGSGVIVDATVSPDGSYAERTIELPDADSTDR